MFLAIDIGNTNITFGVYNNNTLIKIHKISSNKKISQIEYENLIRNFLKNYKIKGCIIGSVVEELSILIKTACDNILNLNSILLTQNSNFGINISVENPHTVGVDRLANAYQASLKYNLPALVVDIGSAITFDIVSKNKEFIGGIIMPGINIQLNSLYEKTSKLPKIEIQKTFNTIGKSTKEAILSGIIKGTAYAINGLISECEKELNETANIILTGGNSDLISKFLPNTNIIIDNNLTLDGLKALYKIN